MDQSDYVRVTVPVVTVIDIGLPRWMTPFAEELFSIPTHMTVQERLMLFQTALGLRTGFSVVEIGSYLGASTAFLAFAATQRGGTVHAVDTWENDAMGHEAQRDTWGEFRRNTQRFEHYIVPHRGHSVTVAQETGGIACDMLFIDGDHTYEGVGNDLTRWRGSLKPGGILAMHDFDSPGVRDAFEDIIGADVMAPPTLIDRLLVCTPRSKAVSATS